MVVHNAGGAANGPIDMSTALQVSSDVYFFNLGLHAQASGNGGQIQDWAFKYGLGRKPQVDIPDASSGLIPTPAWRNRVFHSHKNPYIDRPWNQGDNVNLAVGQGDVQVTPLQLARAYAALANGGTLVRPHVGGRIVNIEGKTVRKIDPPPQRHLRISNETRSVILDGLHRAADEPGGTSYPVMGSFPIPVAGKTGTAERAGTAGPVLVQRDRAVQRPADRRDGHRGARRVRRRDGGADGPRDPRALLQPARRRHRHCRGACRGTGLMEAAKPSLTFAPQRSRVVDLLNLRNLDGIMLAASVGLIAFSVFTLQSAGRHEIAADPMYFVVRQSIYGVIGIALMIAVSHMDYTRWRELRGSIYAVMVGSIAFVLLVGTAVRGSNRWIDLPLFQFQPSELAKVLLCVSLSGFVYERVRRPFGLRQTLGLLGSGPGAGGARLPAARPRHRASCWWRSR